MKDAALDDKAALTGDQAAILRKLELARGELAKARENTSMLTHQLQAVEGSKKVA